MDPEEAWRELEALAESIGERVQFDTMLIALETLRRVETLYFEPQPRGWEHAQITLSFDWSDGGTPGFETDTLEVW